MASKVTRDHHNMRRTVSLNNNKISNDGGDEGISVADNGNVTLSGDLDIDGSKITSAGALEIDSGGAVTITGQHFSIDATKKLGLDSSGDTYITESSSNVLDFFTGSTVRLSLSSTGQFLTGHVILYTSKRLYFDDGGLGGNTYITESAADILDFYVGGVNLLKLTEAGGGASDKVAIPALTPLYFDGGGDTYISESAADTLLIKVGGDTLLGLAEGGDDGNTVNFKNSCAGFTRIQATFSATGVIGSAGTDDTDIDFRFSNKYRLPMTADITNMNLIFPDVSGNFLLVCATNGDHDVTNWKVYESDESAATTADVMWAGGSVPAFTDTGIDIVSFYWDSSEQQAYGVASLAFATP